MDTATALYRITAIALIVLYYLIIMTDMKAKKVTIVYSVLFVTSVAAFFIVNYYQRKKVESDLIQILAIASMGSNMEQQLSESNSYEKLLSDIEMNEQRLNNIIKEKTYFDELFGQSKDVDTLIYRTLNLLNNQKIRIQYLNCKSNRQYTPLRIVDASKELKFLSKDKLNRDYYNSGFKINHSEIFIEDNIVLVRIVEQGEKTVLFQQAYVPKDSVNTFVLPNLFKDDNIELQMGYINKEDTSTYHCIKIKPYGK